MPVGAWLAANGVCAGDVEAVEIPPSWLGQAARKGDPTCEAIRVGKPAQPGLLCSQPYGADGDARWPNDTRWEVWRAEDGKLRRVWDGRQTFDGLPMRLEWDSPERFRVSGDATTECENLRVRMLRKFGDAHTASLGIAPSPIGSNARTFCRQRGDYTWRGYTFQLAE
ncbi:MAG: hypothetical protein R3B07_20030 [Polyangiaceae bacterium]